MRFFVLFNPGAEIKDVGMPLLCIAARCGHLQVVKYLVHEKGLPLVSAVHNPVISACGAPEGNLGIFFSDKFLAS